MKYLVLQQRQSGDVCGRPVVVTAASVSLALKVAPTRSDWVWERNVEWVLVVPFGSGQRVPVWHEAPVFARSDHWQPLGET